MSARQYREFRCPVRNRCLGKRQTCGLFSRSVRWKKYVTPLLVVVLGLAVLITITSQLECVEAARSNR